MTSTIDEEFGSTKCPRNFQSHKLDAFLLATQRAGVKLAIITSGGTTVPLEQSTVRFIDNFSTGTRGALCAEKFLRIGSHPLDSGTPYAVVFLMRTGTTQPFLRRATPSNIADSVRLQQDDAVSNGNKVTVTDTYLLRDLQFLQSVRHRLHTITYTSVHEYLALLQEIARRVRDFHTSVVFVLAAAVSDFYIPTHSIPKHKIQSSVGSGLTLNLSPVPKFLGILRGEWAPFAFVVSFKLETDRAMLAQKVQTALRKYHVHAIVGNLLHTRYDEVTLTVPGKVTSLRRPNGDDIESIVVSELVRLHEEYTRNV